MSPLVALLLLVLIGQGCHEAHTQAPPPPVSSPVSAAAPRNEALFQTFLTAFDSLFQDQLDSSGCPGAAVVVVRDGEVAFLRGYGVRSTSDMSPIGPHTRFRLGSISKGFAGILACMAVQAGLLRLDERVVDILPDFALSDSAQTQRVRVWHLLAHCSGLPRHTYTSRVEGGERRDSILAALRTVPLAGREGEVFAYQNFAFSLIEDILEQRTGRPFSQLLTTYLLQPAGMADATLNPTEWAQTKDRALPHDNDRSGRYFPQAVNRKYFDTPSAGGVVASISDMGEWLRLLLGNKPDVVSHAVLDSAFAPRVATQSRAFVHRWDGSLSSYYGAGWRIIEFGDRQVVCHGGNVNHYRSEIALDRADGLGVCFLFNAMAPGQGRAPARFFDLYRSIVLGIAPPSEAPEGLDM